MIGFGSIGVIDDWLKISKNSSSGLNGKIKLILQILIAYPAIMSIIQYSPLELQNGLALPFFKDVFIYLGYLFIPFSILVVVGASNSVNLTDGLDGLAIVPVMIAASCFALIAYLVGNINFSSYLQLNYVPGVGELSILLGALLGAGLGFLWFNAPPAEIFMGDTGSLALGGALGISSVATRHELVLVIIGGIFVVETISVILQVGYFKITGRRIFLMAPLHHHFEKRGWAEPTIVIRFWIIAVILALIGLSTLKLR
jgi:phospho-N-acetylmuramoyl-pentapeptide-transferase